MEESMSSVNGILFVGNALADRTAYVPFDFVEGKGLKPGSLNPIETFERIESLWKEAGGDPDKWTIGGSSQNSAQVCKRLDESLSVSFLTKLGNDPRAEVIRDTLTDIGIDVLGTSVEKPTGVVNCYVNKNDGQRTMEFYSEVAAQFGGNDIHDVYFNNQLALHLEGYLGYCGDILERSVEFGRKNRLMSSLSLSDVNVVETFSDRFNSLVKQVDYVFGNREEMELLTGKESIEAMTRFFDKGQTIFITDGANGSYANGFHYPAAPVEYVVDSDNDSDEEIFDTNGCGDAYLGAALSQIYNNRPLSQVVDVASRAAAEVIKVRGTQIPEKRIQALIDYITFLNR
jgi:sugar/nucleoside kinase (ribokinase family)